MKRNNDPTPAEALRLYRKEVGDYYTSHEFDKWAKSKGYSVELTYIVRRCIALQIDKGTKKP